jgi:hypothetical protein
MIMTESLIAVALLLYALRRNFITDYGLIIYVMMVVFVFSLFPSLSIPYIIDDVDHFHLLAVAVNSHQVVQWLMMPHNEHVIPLIKAIYLLCYHYFWLNPEIFHVIILGVAVGILVLIYKLVLALTQNPLAALIGASIMAATNLTDDALFIGTNAHVFFCMLLFLFLFYAIYQYALQQHVAWRWAAFLAILIVPWTFALGLTSIIFVLLFYCLCVPQDLKPNVVKLLPLLLIGWILSLLPYAHAISAIIHTNHYHDIGAHSIFGIIRFMGPIIYLCQYVASKLIPCVFTNAYLSFGLFFLCAYIIIVYTGEIAWKRILFFALFGLFNNFIIFVFREAWGTEKLDTARYYVFPVVMIAFCYPLLLDIYIKHTPQIKKVSTHLLVYLLCFFAVINGGLYRYQNSDMLLKRTMMMQNLYVNFRKAFVDYFQEHPTLGALKLEDGSITLPPVFWPPSKPGMVFPLARYRDRKISFYASFILPAVISQKIIWSDKTDPDFLAYLIANKDYFLINGKSK